MFRINPRNITDQDTRKHSIVAPNEISTVTVSSLRCKAQAAQVRRNISQGMSSESTRCSHEPEKKKHYEILKKLSQNMAPNNRTFWKKEAVVKTTTQGPRASSVLGRENRTTSRTCPDCWCLQMPRPKCGCKFGVNVIVQWNQKWKQLCKWPQSC